MRSWLIYWAGSLILLELVHRYARGMSLVVGLACIGAGVWWYLRKEAPHDSI